MAGVRWSEEEDNIIRSNFGKLYAEDIAALLPGRTRKAVLHRAKALGLKHTPETHGAMLSAAFDAEMEAQLGEPIGEWLMRRYVAEKATYREICRELNINTRTLMRWMRANSIEPIDASAAAKRSWKTSPHMRNAFAPDVQRRRALSIARSRQERWETFMNAGEYELFDALRAAGLNPVPQLAVSTFNIDFAFPAVKLAVEYDSRWHNSPVKRPMDRRKDAYLTSRGWTVLRLDTRVNTSYNVQKVSDALQSLASSHPR